MSNIGWPTPVTLASAAGDLPGLWRAPALGRDNPRNILFVPPFAEEMNRTRRTMTLVAELLAPRGIGSLIFDLPGTGETAGAFAEAGWQDWCAGVRAGIAHVAAHGAPAVLMGFRLGCLLALEALAASDVPAAGAILVAPVDSGRQHLRHWLRVRTAASLEVGPKLTIGGLQQQLEAGETVFTAGYPLTPGLAGDIARRDYGPLLAAAAVPVVRVEVGSAAERVEAAPGRRHVTAAAPWLVAEPAEPSLLAEGLARIAQEWS